MNLLLKGIERNGNEGIGKPEALTHGFQGFWSRRITDEHRLVYRPDEGTALIAQCRYHYEACRPLSHFNRAGRTRTGASQVATMTAVIDPAHMIAASTTT